MKNIEKYTNTKDAIAAYNKLDFKRVPFDIWLECEYEEPHVQTLLEAAEAVVKVGYGTFVADLRSAVEREKAKPVRNCDKYRTAKDAFAGFNKMCEEKKCSTCPFSAERNECLNCSFNWLFAEAEKEVSK